jgi:hypothetical protein
MKGISWLLAAVLVAAVSLPAAAQQVAGAAYDDMEAQLRVRQALYAASTAAREVEELRKALQSEHQRVLLTDEERDLNRETIAALEKNLRAAEAKLGAREAALKEAQDVRRLGLAEETQRQKIEEARRRLAENEAATQQTADLKGAHWIADASTGCRVWDANPVAGESIKWTGACQNNLAQGRGALQWFKDGKLAAQYEGDVRDGKANGRGIFSWVSGGRYEGEFRDDRPNGAGTFRHATGRTYSGPWTNGCFRQGERRAAVMVSNRDCGF